MAVLEISGYGYCFKDGGPYEGLHADVVWLSGLSSGGRGVSVGNGLGVTVASSIPHECVPAIPQGWLGVPPSGNTGGD